MIDWFGEKNVTFGLPGVGKINTLVKGTMIDDNIFLLGVRYKF